MFKETDFLDENFYKIIDFVSANIYWKDKEGRYLGCNQYALNKFGLKSFKEAIGKNDYEVLLIPENEIAQIIENDKYALKHGIFEGEEYVTFNGEKITYLSKKVSFLNEKGEVAGTMGTSLDITNQKRLLELELERQKIILEEQLKVTQIIDSVNASIYWKDQKGEKYLGCNQYMLNMCGAKTREEIIGKTEYDFLSNEDAQKIHDIDLSVLANGYFEGEESFTWPNGEEKTYFTVKNQLTDSSGKVIGLVGTSIDITNQKKLIELERKNLILEEQLKVIQIIDSVNASIYWKDKKSEKYLGCNQYMLDMFGMKNREEIIGKSEFDFLSYEDAQKINNVDSFVLTNGRYEGEESFTLPNGEVKTYYTIKSQLTDSEGNVTGVVGTSLDITSQKEAEHFRLENEMQKVVLQEKEKFAQLARKVAHDINSPLSALKMMIPLCDELPEDKRISLNRATESIWDIANNLLRNFHQQKRQTTSTSEVEPRQPLLVSDLLTGLLSEKKMEYRNQSVRFNTIISDDAQFAFIQCQSIELRRAMSNLINNAVDALEGKSDGVVTIELITYDNKVVVEVADNGCGMPSVMKERMRRRQSFTTGKENRHGLGLQQVWDTLEYNEGEMDVQSTPRQGTTIKLVFAMIAAPGWIAQEIHLTSYSIILILDDDESIHSAWNLRFISLLNANPTLRLHHFTQGQEVLDFLAVLSQEEKENVVFLSDYELLHQTRNGLQIIEASEIDRAILVTSYYSNPQVQEEAKKLRVKILPKQMASIIPIYIDTDHN